MLCTCSFFNLIYFNFHPIESCASMCHWWSALVPDKKDNKPKMMIKIKPTHHFISTPIFSGSMRLSLFFSFMKWIEKLQFFHTIKISTKEFLLLQILLLNVSYFSFNTSEQQEINIVIASCIFAKFLMHRMEAF